MLIFMMTGMNTYIRKYDIFYVYLGSERNGSVQNGGSTGIRPCIVINNKVACSVSPVLLVVPITSSNGKHAKELPTHLDLGYTLKKHSVAMFEQILTVNRYQLKSKIASLSENLIEAADEKLKISLGLIPQYA